MVCFLAFLDKNARTGKELSAANIGSSQDES